ncbi:type II toxin-antitoxin system RelE/ParE family toxin [Phyllobacterium bourgognense]|uniref:Toxin ParE1/3/4 n=1 Tax=Phyllobacterium bourgognense TaxID=314236 RepID=A0A368Z2R5_9HYPH|nr:type II toxin-antitoxin system RelE/ParE family toxin [Phyllobacterium bourgognense]RCW85517.1 toxin ParE1/3/4 [Phyllobacterium bourgognense]
MTHRVLFSPQANIDLRELYLYIAADAGRARAIAYLERIEIYCRGFANFPERGMKRDDLWPGLRVVGFERRVTIAFHFDTDTVTFDRILYGGRDLPNQVEQD